MSGGNFQKQFIRGRATIANRAAIHIGAESPRSGRCRRVLSRTAMLLAASLVLTSCNLLSKETSSSFTSSWVRPEDPQEQIGAREHPLVVAKYGGEYHNEKAERMLAITPKLTMPRYPLLPLQEFRTVAARDHFIVRKREAYPDMEALRAKTREYLAELAPLLEDLAAEIAAPEAINGKVKANPLRNQ